MTYIIAILISLMLLVGFLTLTGYEAAHGIRVFGGLRRRLDRRVGQVGFIIAHVDLGAFVRDTMRDGFERVVHDVAHASLIAVRFLERLLTRVVRKRRVKTSDPDAPPKRTVGEALQHLRSTLRLRRLSIKKEEGK